MFTKWEKGRSGGRDGHSDGAEMRRRWSANNGGDRGFTAGKSARGHEPQSVVALGGCTLTRHGRFNCIRINVLMWAFDQTLQCHYQSERQRWGALSKWPNGCGKLGERLARPAQGGVTLGAEQVSPLQNSMTLGITIIESSWPTPSQPRVPYLYCWRWTAT